LSRPNLRYHLSISCTDWKQPRKPTSRFGGVPVDSCRVKMTIHLNTVPRLRRRGACLHSVMLKHGATFNHCDNLTFYLDNKTTGNNSLRFFSSHAWTLRSDAIHTASYIWCLERGSARYVTSYTGQQKDRGIHVNCSSVKRTRFGAATYSYIQSFPQFQQWILYQETKIRYDFLLTVFPDHQKLVSINSAPRTQHLNAADGPTNQHHRCLHTDDVDW